MRGGCSWRRLAFRRSPTLAEPSQRRPVRDRDVLLAAVLVVAFVLIFAWLTGLIPVLDNAIGLAPVVIVGMIVVTVVVLIRALLPKRGTG
jgi:Mg/Co/Ni transporter MgtE